jgi:hypothetical protein
MLKSELDAVRDIGTFVYKNPGTAGTILGAGALAIGTGPLAIGLGVSALGLGVAGARNSFHDKDWVGFGLDVAGMVPGASGVTKSIKAVAAGSRATRLGRDAQAAARAADHALRSGAAKAGEYNPHSVNASYLQGMSKQAETKAHSLESQGRRLDEIGVGIGSVGAARTFLPRIGIEHPPVTSSAASLQHPQAILRYLP